MVQLQSSENHNSYCSNKDNYICEYMRAIQLFEFPNPAQRYVHYKAPYTILPQFSLDPKSFRKDLLQLRSNEIDKSSHKSSLSNTQKDFYHISSRFPVRFDPNVLIRGATTHISSFQQLVNAQGGKQVRSRDSYGRKEPSSKINLSR